MFNKNITEEDILSTCQRVFSRGWNKIKLYFMIGLPTEGDEDVVGIAQMGRQALQLGRRVQRNVNVTVSVSSHVPKPHTPFQWSAMDSIGEIERKQNILRATTRRWSHPPAPRCHLQPPQDRIPRRLQDGLHRACLASRRPFRRMG
jgi:radical SAM superfamily enzyme YgiQ (UPF0313 family)